MILPGRGVSLPRMKRREPSLLRELETHFGRHQDRYLAEWIALLRIPSVSADPAHRQDCARCAEWLARRLARLGFKPRLLKTRAHPAVFAQRPGARDAPTVLFYGHYDVQPADPLAAWTTPPFDPHVRAGRVYARGAEDNKGQLMYVLAAMETLIAQNAPLPALKILLEGEEECGSAGLSEALPRWRHLLRADILLVADTGTAASGAPAIIMGLRGIMHASIALTGPKHDLHSGMHGGVAPNPATEMARLLATLHTPDGAIAVPGFARGVVAPTRRERALANAEAVAPRAYRRTTGVPPAAGEKDFTPAERLGFRPSIDVNGIHAGYSGRGIKTIIPARAEAKITARLARGQEPAAALRALIRHLEAHAPAGLRLRVTEKGISGPALRINPDSPLVAKARRVLSLLSRQEPALLWEGASIPVITALARSSGAEPLLVGFGHDKDRVHAPNESFSLQQFKRGYLYAALMLRAIADASFLPAEKKHSPSGFAAGSSVDEDAKRT